MGLFSISKDEVEFEDTPYGKGAIVKAPWSDRIENCLKENQIQSIHYAPGLTSARIKRDLNFLREFPGLKALAIATAVEDLEPIHNLHNLKSITLLSYRDEFEVRFAEFRHLEECNMYWSERYSSIFDCENLKCLNISEFKDKNVKRLLKLKNLERLNITNSPLQDLRGIGGLKKLKNLSFSYLRKLKDLAGLEELPSLERLDFSACGSINFETVKELTSLKFLILEIRKIKSINFLISFPNLEGFDILGEDSKIIDGDLAILGKLKKLKKLDIPMRKHYKKLPDYAIGLLEKSKKDRKEFWKKYWEDHPQ